MRVGLLLACLALSACMAATDDKDDLSDESHRFGGPATSDGSLSDGTMSPTDAGEPDATGLGSDAGASADVGDVVDCGPLTLCQGRCVDLDTDISNCGECAHTCALFNAESSCVTGACAIESCLGDFVDEDGNPDNGCEEENLCDDGAECVTACGIGQTQCDGPVATCVAPAESCNAIDDNCDNQCDEGEIPGCRRGIHRAFGGAQGHAYADDLNWLTSANFRVEAANYFYLYQEPHQGMRPAQLCPEGDGRYFLSSDNACEIGRAPIAVIGFWSPTPVCGAIPLYRLYRPDLGIHFYTTGAAERDRALSMLGYIDEGIAGYVWPSP